MREQEQRQRVCAGPIGSMIHDWTERELDSGEWKEFWRRGGVDFFMSPALCVITVLPLDMAVLLGSGYSSYVTDMIRWVGLGVRLGH